jgi:hypothetical protein
MMEAESKIIFYSTSSGEVFDGRGDDMKGQWVGDRGESNDDRRDPK